MEKTHPKINGPEASDFRVRGLVVIEKEDGTVVLEKENMIVSGGRSYIAGLVSGAIGGSLTSGTKKITEIRFGTGGATVPESSQTALVAAETDYDNELDTTLVWKKSTATVSSGSTNPSPAVLGEYFYNTTDLNLYVGTTGPVWTEASNYDVGTSFPDISLASEDDLFYNTGTGKLYVASIAFEVTSLSSPYIGLRFDCTIRGIVGSEANISELGLFTNDTTPVMFSRLAFDPIPLTGDVDAYNISYYVYF